MYLPDTLALRNHFHKRYFYVLFSSDYYFEILNRKFDELDSSQNLLFGIHIGAHVKLDRSIDQNA